MSDEVQMRQAVYLGCLDALSENNPRIKELEAERDKYKKVIKDYLEGNYIHPRTYRPKDCPHGQGYWEECEQCNYEHFVKALEES